MSTFFRSSIGVPAAAPPPPKAAVPPGVVAPPPPPPPSLCPSDLPLVLLPVRLETRFFTAQNGTIELRVRVYPDKIHLNSHEPDLTPDESTWGQHYWTQDWLAGTDATARANAWRQLADRFGAPRAAWIVRRLTPTNAGQRPTGTPTFPTLTLASSESTWRHAPQAQLLPDRWIAVLHVNGQAATTVTSADIRKPLNVGPDPNAPEPSVEVKAAIERGDQLPVDDGMKWLVDFNAAETAGMALRIPIQPAQLNNLDSLLVFGVLRGVSSADSAMQLADLLDAHHYTDGLAFLRPGTATNNTEDRRADYSSDDPGQVRSFNLEIVPPSISEETNAQRVASALGIPTARLDATFGHIERGLASDNLDARAMNTALWQVGWGYFLSNMIGMESGISTASIDWARRHFLDQVRCFGPFPTLRCGTQPYGILPVTSLTAWQPGASEGLATQDSWLQQMLKTLRDVVWRPAASAVPRVGGRALATDANGNPLVDADGDLLDVMRSDAVSAAYNTRNVFGRHFLQHLYSQMLSGFANTDPAQTALLGQIGASWTPRLAHLWNANWVYGVTAPLVQAGEVSPWIGLTPNYIETLLNQRDVDQLITAVLGSPAPLLQTLLRHALLREIAYGAARLQTQDNTTLITLLRDAELIDLVGSPLVQPANTLHFCRQLGVKVAATGTQTIGEYLKSTATFTEPGLEALGEFRASLARLKSLDSEALLLLMQGTLDLSAHRLDAWITSIATKRLAAMRSASAAGQYIGAYGWVENLGPIPTNRAKPVTTLPAGEPEPLQSATNDSGFIHAPSPAHAAAAALLRNAHLGASGVPTATGPFAIDLSSRRTREAVRLLEGVREGQPLGALLGYRIERMLHEARVGGTHSLDYLIAPLRTLAPLVSRKREGDSAPIETIAANNVVDGLALQRLYKDTPATITNKAVAGDQSALETILRKLDDMIDAVSDALTAEAAYQMARGNGARLASTLTTIATGEAPPPELEVTRTPRSGRALTHRVAVLFSGAANSGSGWGLSYNSTQRPLAERWLNAWVQQLLGDARKIRCTVERLDDATGAVVETLSFTLSEVLVTPLDFVYFAGNNGQTANSALSYAEQLVLYQSRRRTGGFAVQAKIRLQHARPNTLATGEWTLFDALEQARAIRQVLQGARGLTPDDLAPSGSTSQATLNTTELQSRVERIENALGTYNKAFAAQVAKGTATTADEFRTSLLNLGQLGIALAVPCVAVGDDPATRAQLLQQAAAVLKDSSARLDQVTAKRAIPLATDTRARVRQLIERAQLVCGREFVVLPYFTCDSASGTELTSALAASTSQQDGDALAVNTWFTRAARVRGNLNNLGACLNTAEVLTTGARMKLGIAQLPFNASERWVGLPLAPGGELPAGKLSLVLQTAQVIDTAQPLCGLFIDEWVEVVPNARETTGIAFQFDVPNACAPQSVLVAVPPVPGQDWTAEGLRTLLMETLYHAKLRAVEPSMLGAAAQHLPGLYLAFNNANHTVSTDFNPLTA